MYPSHTSPSQPGPHSRWTCLKKSHRACFPHDSLLSLPPSLCCLSLKPLLLTACLSLTRASAEQQQWSLYCLVTWLQFKPWGSVLGLRFNDSQGLSEWNGSFLLPFNNRPPLQPSPKSAFPLALVKANQSACPGINTELKGQNAQISTNWCRGSGGRGGWSKIHH